MYINENCVIFVTQAQACVYKNNAVLCPLVLMSASKQSPNIGLLKLGVVYGFIDTMQVFMYLLFSNQRSTK